MLAINKRLLRVCSFVKGRRLADIGSDHAYLPIYLAKKNKIDYAIAGEIVKGPHEISKKNVAEEKVSDVVECRKAAGLKAIELEDNIEVITICGMGGRLISDILLEGKEKLNNYPMLILQPNMAEWIVRETLEKLGYNIIEEDILKEDGHIYEIIIATKGNMNLNNEEKYFGKYLFYNRPLEYKEKYNKEIEKIEYIMEQLKKSKKEKTEKVAELLKEKEWLLAAIK